MKRMFGRFFASACSINGNKPATRIRISFSSIILRFPRLFIAGSLLDLRSLKSVTRLVPQTVRIVEAAHLG